MKIPTWLYKEWFNDKKYITDNKLGLIEGSFSIFTNLKKNNVLNKTILTLYKSQKENDLKIPLKLNIELKENEKQKTFKHKDKKMTRCSDRGPYYHQFIFESQKQFMPGFKVLAITDLKDQTKWVNGIIKEILEKKLKILIEGSDKLEIFEKKQVRLIETETIKIVKSCNILGLVEATIQAKPIMNRKYAIWLKNKIFKYNTRHKITFKVFKNLKKRIEERIRRIKLKYIKIPRMKRVRQKDEVYLNMILKAFDKKKYLDHKSMVSITGESWNFLKKIVENCCNCIEDNKYEKKFTLKENYKISHKSV